MADELGANTRRGVLAGVGVVGLTGVLAACGGSSGSGATSNSSGNGSSSSAGGGSTSTSSGGGSAGSGSSSGGSSTTLAKTSDIPVGGGKIFGSEKVVVTQPTSGEFKCFSAVYTHMGCTVDSVSGGTINCPCHGSKYNIATAAVVSGPASTPLPSKHISVSNGEITLA